MADTTDREQSQEVGEVASELPDKNLPAATYKDLPEPSPLRRMLGPGVVAIAIGLSSGEIILWPYITSQVGLVFLWAAVVGVLTQFFLNMEVERYTLATGETAITGFSRFWKPWGLVFCFGAILPNIFPGWATASATAFTFAIGGGNVILISIIALVIIGLVLTLSPVVYQTVEKIEFFKIGAVALFLLVVVLGVVSAQAWGDVPGATAEGFGRLPEGLPVAVVLGALAFAGAGGVHNLVLSNWIRDKGFGMGAYIPRIVSPVTGEDQARPSTGYVFPETEANLSRWKGWWRVANIEQFVSFFLIGTVSIILMSMLAYSTVFGQDLGQDLEFLRNEGEVLGSVVGEWFQIFFYTIAAISLFGGALGILDYVGRAIADVLKVSYLAESRTWSESRLYSTVVWAMILTGIVILLAGLNQPLILLVISGSISGVIMFVYSILLIKLNRTSLPQPIRVRGVRLLALFWSVGLFGVISAIILWDQITSAFGG